MRAQRVTRRAGYARRPRKGVSLVELIVAMTIMMAGLLAIVGTSAGITRNLGEARADNTAAIAAQSRFERIAGSACSGVTLDAVAEAETRGVTERYVVRDGGNFTLRVIDSVTWTTRSGTRRQVFETLLPCRPGA